MALFFFFLICQVDLFFLLCIIDARGEIMKITSLKDLKVNLENIINNSDTIFIAPHKGVDVDALASSLAMYIIANKLGKKAHIVIDDNLISSEAGVQKIISELPDATQIIPLDEVKANLDVHNSLICVDTNKKNLVPAFDYSVFSDKVIIDHHQTDEHTIESTVEYINPHISSASEILYHLMTLFNIKPEEIGQIINIYNYLLGGISLDTAKFSKNISAETMNVVSKLMKKGADINYVNDLFMEDFESDMRVQGLVSKTEWNMFNIGIAMNNEDPHKIYLKEDLAKAADCLLKYKTSDAAFVMGYIEEYIVYISARSKGIIDVSGIMHEFGGGGSICSAAARIEEKDIQNVNQQLKKLIMPGYRITNM